MAENTNIAWCDSTWNPWIGCTRISEGCSGCYAAVSIPARFLGVKWGPRAQRHRTSGSNWKKPLAWNQKAAETGKPWRVFCGSLCDVFDNAVPDDWRDGLWELIRLTSHLHWIIVTKRIGNVPKMVPERWMRGGFPPHVRLLITVVNQEEAERDIWRLLALPCKNGVSYEPALSAVDWQRLDLANRITLDALTGLHRGSSGPSTIEQCLSNLPSLPGPYSRGIEWLIVGGESDQPGHKARPFFIEQARSTIEACRATGVPAFVKQLGSAPTWHIYQQPLLLKDRAGADPHEWPKYLRIREFPA